MTLFITDLDGTLLNYAGKMKPRATGMLNRMINKGTLFTYATARGFLSSRRLTSELKLNIPIITMNGAIICDSESGERMHIERLDDKLHNKALLFFKEHNETPLVYSVIDNEERVSFLENDVKCIKKYLSDRKGDKRFRPCKEYAALFEGEVFYYCLINARSGIDNLRRFFSAEKDCFVNYQEDTYNKNQFWCEVFSKNATKANGVKRLQSMIGADKLVVFGDNVNDISMFEVADECYAVENAYPELKKIATGIIPSNNELGVPCFIEQRVAKIFDYTPKPEIIIKPDKKHFNEALQKTLFNKNNFPASPDGLIGTLNEKLIHALLKNYFSADYDQEAKIGPYYADAIGENGIIEIQTSSFNKLRGKLDCFLDTCHVTIVYPYEKKVHNISVNAQNGELIKKSLPRTFTSKTKFFRELYRIKDFLTHPNLSFCIVELEIEKTCFFSDERCLKHKRQHVDKNPIDLISEIYLQKKEDFSIFLPKNLPKTFDKKVFSMHSKQCDGSILLEILEYLSIVRKIDKQGNSIIYEAVQRS